MSTSYDIVLFGATGYTGKLVAEYLAKKKERVAIALAGRDKAKLEAVRSELGVVDWPIEIADALDPGQVDALVKKTRVVCTTVGPYSRYGRPLVDACAANGVGYCDLTGETPFMRESIDANHETAKKTGARIVHACGFDSIPSDLGVFVVHRLAAEKQKALATVRLRFTKIKGKVSGGTASSAMAIAERAGDKKVRRVLGNPHALDPDPRKKAPSDRQTPFFDETSGHWLGPFFMAPVNTRVVRRSAALIGTYGSSFSYDEVVDTGPGARGWYFAARQSALVIGLVGAMVTPGAKQLLKRFAPKPGEGPTREERERGSFRGEIDAFTEDGQRILGRVGGTSDPGYGETAKMLAESALCLALDPIPREGGVLTPASCMGGALVKRLVDDARMTFSAEWA